MMYYVPLFTTVDDKRLKLHFSLRKYKQTGKIILGNACIYISTATPVFRERLLEIATISSIASVWKETWLMHMYAAELFTLQNAEGV